MSAEDSRPDAMRELVEATAVAIRRRDFADALREHGAIAAHPDTIAALLSRHPAIFGGVRMVPVRHMERGQLYTGAEVAAAAHALDAAEGGPWLTRRRTR